MPNMMYCLIPGDDESRIHILYIRKLPSEPKSTQINIVDKYSLRVIMELPPPPLKDIDHQLRQFSYKQKVYDKYFKCKSIPMSLIITFPSPVNPNQEIIPKIVTENGFEWIRIELNFETKKDNNTVYI